QPAITPTRVCMALTPSCSEHSRPITPSPAARADGAQSPHQEGTADDADTAGSLERNDLRETRRGSSRFGPSWGVPRRHYAPTHSGVKVDDAQLMTPNEARRSPSFDELSGSC